MKDVHVDKLLHGTTSERTREGMTEPKEQQALEVRQMMQHHTSMKRTREHVVENECDERPSKKGKGKETLNWPVTLASLFLHPLAQVVHNKDEDEDEDAEDDNREDNNKDEDTATPATAVACPDAGIDTSNPSNDEQFDLYCAENLLVGEYFAMIERVELNERDRRLEEVTGIEPKLHYESLTLLNNLELTMLFLLRKTPYRMYSRLMQHTETGTFLLCNRMELEFRMHNRNKFPVRVMLAVHNPSQSLVQSVYPQHSTVITSLDEDFARILPGRTETITIQASQFGKLCDGQHAQLLLIALRDSSGASTNDGVEGDGNSDGNGGDCSSDGSSLDLQRTIQQIRQLQFPLDPTSKYALCHEDVYISNYVFEKFTRRHQRQEDGRLASI